MPELPEAETIVRGLAPRLPGRTIVAVKVTHVDILAPLSASAFRKALRGCTVESVGRRAKKILIRFVGGRMLLVNLGMTGRLVLSRAPRATELKHVAVRFNLDDGEALLYDDVRRFGRLEVHDAGSWSERESALGAEPLDPAFTGAELHRMTQRSITPIRNWLLDQRRVAGIGNIYANEALFRAAIDPRRAANTLSLAEATALHETLRQVLQESIEARGTTLNDYRDAAGEEGGFAIRLDVYAREGEPCPRCGTPVQRAVLSNRSLF
ncbi:MAG TPA: bifunctional DNA-formamidopyrimidine glycosylase/DNA-(apurinic or apyrimidinic site) lyase, partial [Longimicrobiales bacterium]